MRKMILFGLSLFLTLSLCAQKKIKGNGDVTTIERITPAYEIISVSGLFDIELVEGLEGRLILEGETNILENIKTVVNDGVLIIEPDVKSQLKPSRQIGVQITVPVESINSIALSGSGNLLGPKLLKVDKLNISVSGNGNIDLALDAKFVDVRAAGSGKVILSGHADELNASLSGDGNLNSYEMNVDQAQISTAGGSKARVNVSELLSASASGNGHLWYKGDPTKVESSTSGDGKIKMISN